MDNKELKPGRELDAAVAVALGGEYDKSSTSIFWPDGSCEDWEPSQTWNGAGLVVEKLAAEGVHVQIGNCGNDRWWCCMHRTGTTEWFSKDAPTMPYAVCLAALESIGQNTFPHYRHPLLYAPRIIVSKH